jgi:hypothetical protein
MSICYWKPVGIKVLDHKLWTLAPVTPIRTKPVWTSLYKDAANTWHFRGWQFIFFRGLKASVQQNLNLRISGTEGVFSKQPMCISQLLRLTQFVLWDVKWMRISSEFLIPLVHARLFKMSYFAYSIDCKLISDKFRLTTYSWQPSQCAEWIETQHPFSSIF